jgi:hypothetical protein
MIKQLKIDLAAIHQSMMHIKKFIKNPGITRVFCVLNKEETKINRYEKTGF